MYDRITILASELDEAEAGLAIAYDHRQMIIRAIEKARDNRQSLTGLIDRLVTAEEKVRTAEHKVELARQSIQQARQEDDFASRLRETYLDSRISDEDAKVVWILARTQHNHVISMERAYEKVASIFNRVFEEGMNAAK